MGRIEKYDIRRPITKEEMSIMSGYKKYHKSICKNSKAENRFYYEYLKPIESTHGIYFTRQAMRGSRIFDFWCKKLGVVVEVDGGYHEESWKKKKDEKHDRHCYEVGGIIVYRVPNYNAGIARDTINKIKEEDMWGVRRRNMGLSCGGAFMKQIEDHEKGLESCILDIDVGKLSEKKNKKISKKEWYNKNRLMTKKERKRYCKEKDAIDKLGL